MAKKKYYGNKKTAGIGNAPSKRCNLPDKVMFAQVPFFPSYGMQGMDDSMHEIDRAIYGDMQVLSKRASRKVKA